MLSTFPRCAITPLECRWVEVRPKETWRDDGIQRSANQPVLLVTIPAEMSYLTQTTMRALRAAPIAPRLRSIALRPAALALARPFSSTQYRRASEVPKDPIADPEIQGFYEKLRNHQGAVDAMMKMAELMKEKGELVTERAQRAL